MAVINPGVSTPIGLDPVRTLSSSTYNGQVKTYVISNSSNAVNTGIYNGDPVTYAYTLGGSPVAGTFNYTGVIQQYNATPTTGTDLPILGVFVGCFYISPGVNTPYTYKQASSIPNGTTFAANTLPIAMVIDDPMVVFQIQADNTATLPSNTTNYPSTVQGYVGLNIQVKNSAANAGNSNGNSTFVANINSLTGNLAAANSAYPLKIRGFVPEQTYPQVALSQSASMTSPYAVFEVVINNHIYKPGTVSA